MLRACCRGGQLTQLAFCDDVVDETRADSCLDGRDAALLDAVEAQLHEYFARRRTEFDLPLDLQGPVFHRRVWSALREIPYGQTISYLQLARNIGDERAVRAVGAANGANPIAIIVPCHRVIGADGSLVGYGGGLERKRLLLDLESNRIPLALG